MASILEFRPPEFEGRREVARREPAGPADIVLFPGVRYERWAEGAPEPAKPRRRARRRDHLDLDD